METTRRTPRRITRRDALCGLGAVAVSIPLAQLLGCGEDETARGTSGLGGSGGEAGAGGSGGSGGTGGVGGEAGTGGTGGVIEPLPWATGGTAAIVASRYPNPFIGAGGTSCDVTCSAIIGPCHTTSPLREDVSDGLDGLPVRMSFRVVDPQCNPVEDAIVEIWHTNAAGIYSGEIDPMCNDAAEDRAAQYFRGYLRTDANGRVDFRTCFPGWYPGRAIHVHIRVMKGEYNAADGATAWVITQLLFDDELVQGIFANEPLYRDHGQPDTLLAQDGVTSGESDVGRYLFDVQRIDDGAMLASKTLVLRTALTEALCRT